MNKITYKTVKSNINVYLEGKKVGVIKATLGGWAYFPKSSRKEHGQVFPFVYMVQQSIEKE